METYYKYSCDRCGAKFRDKGHLATHIKRVKECPPLVSTMSQKEMREKYGVALTFYHCGLCGRHYRSKYQQYRHRENCWKTLRFEKRMDLYLSLTGTKIDFLCDDPMKSPIGAIVGPSALEIEEMPSLTPGVYFLAVGVLEGKALFKFGSTGDLPRRLKEHARKFTLLQHPGFEPFLQLYYWHETETMGEAKRMEDRMKYMLGLEDYWLGRRQLLGGCFHKELFALANESELQTVYKQGIKKVFREIEGEKLTIKGVVDSSESD